MSTTIEVQPTSTYHEDYWTDTFFFSGTTAIYIGLPITREPYRASILFPNVSIPPKAQINSAYLSGYSPANQSDVVNVEIYGNYTSSPVSPTNIAEGDALALTSRYINWNITSSWSTGEWINTPDISTLVQQLVDHPQWATDQSMQIIFRNKSTEYYNSRRWSTYGADPALATKLTVEYQLQRDQAARPKVLVEFNVLGLLEITPVPGGLMPS